MKLFVVTLLIVLTCTACQVAPRQVISPQQPPSVPPRRGAGTERSQPTPAREQALDNFVAFARLLGYVRHFHPSDQASGTNWEPFAVDGMQAVAGAKDSADLARILEDLFRAPAPTVRVFPTEQRPPVPDALSPTRPGAALHVVAWRHHGFGGSSWFSGSPYVSERVYQPAPHGVAPPDMPHPREPLYADLGAGISCLVPLALFVDDQRTLPHAPRASATKLATASRLSEAQATRLATVALAWNVFAHFYPYFDVVATDWPRTLRETLAAAYTAADEAQFYHSLQRLVAQLHDGHGQVENIYHPRYSIPPHRPPFGWDWIEDRLVITFVEPEAEGQLQPGEIVTAVNGQPTATAMAAQAQVVSGATRQWIRLRVLANLLTGPRNSTLTLDLQPASGPPHQATLKRMVPMAGNPLNFTEQRPAPVTELRPGLWYVDLTRIDDTQFDTALPHLSQARGIVFDMRGYPANISPAPIGHLIDRPVTSVQQHVPIITYPDQQKLAFEFSNWPVAPRRPRLKGQIAFITDGRAISYAETYMGIIEHYQLGEIIGSATAGTNGSMSQFFLFSRYAFGFTGMKVLKHDGSPHHGVGIHPTVPVARTIRGVAAGRDEVLERAIEVVSD